MAIPQSIFAALPILRPSRDIIEPSLWERHYPDIIIIFLLLVLLAIIRFKQIKNVAPRPAISQQVVSKEALLRLQNEKHNTDILDQISHHFHLYISSKLETTDALTSVELLNRIKTSLVPNMEVFQSIQRYLSDIEALKFAGIVSTVPSANFARRALEIIEAWENAEKAERSKQSP